MGIGVFVGFELLPEELTNSLKKAEEMGFPHVQIWAPRGDEFYRDSPQRVMMIDAARNSNLEITSMFAAFPGSERYWDAELTNARLRDKRTERMLEIADLAKEMGIKTITSHIGHITSDRDDPNYKTTVKAVRKIADHCAENGQQFRLETGMESAAVLRRFIISVDKDNVKVNFDPANLIMGGYEGTVEALDQLGEFVVEVHLKDGTAPAPEVKADEYPLGQGDVDFEGMLRKLKEIGFEGPLTIEREITGEEQVKDILAGRNFIESMKRRLEIE